MDLHQSVLELEDKVENVQSTNTHSSLSRAEIGQDGGGGQRGQGQPHHRVQRVPPDDEQPQ